MKETRDEHVHMVRAGAISGGPMFFSLSSG